MAVNVRSGVSHGGEELVVLLQIDSGILKLDI
jgi:hypothetical protein